MSARPVDEEKGEGGLKAFESRTGDVTIEPASPKSSQGSTLVGRTSTCSDEKTGHVEPVQSVWSRRFGSVLSSLGRRRKSRSDESDDEEESGSEDEVEESIVRKIHEQPKGYPMTATYLDSDENFMLYRRFGYLQSRLLLDRQEELRLLEMKLDLMEYKEKKSNPSGLKTRQDMSSQKKELLEEIEIKWNAYCQLLSNAATMTALNKPTAGEQYSVARWIKNVDPLRSAEASFINCKEDLITLRPGREHAWLDSSVEKMLKWCRWAPIKRAFQSPDTRKKSNGEDGTVLYTRSRIENFVVSIITLMILALLVVPIWILYRLSDEPQVSTQTSFACIGVLLVSTLAFSACISLFTRARRHEILAASAAYCAVLVVFIGNIGHAV